MTGNAISRNSSPRLPTLALLGGAAAALIDFNWNLLEIRPHELYPDLLLRPLLFLFIASSTLVAAGLWIGRRFEGTKQGAKESS